MSRKADYAQDGGDRPARSPTLPPPGASGSIRLDWFSPNFTHGPQLGLTDIQPFPAYRHIYPFQPEVLANLRVLLQLQLSDAPQDVEMLYEAGGRAGARVARRVRRILTCSRSISAPCS